MPAMKLHTLPRQVTALLVLWAACTGMGHAADINTATEAELDSIRGIGPATSRRILAEREKKGPFRDWPDLMARVKGIQETTASRYAAQGLTVNGQPLPPPQKPGATPAERQ